MLVADEANFDFLGRAFTDGPIAILKAVIGNKCILLLPPAGSGET